MPGPMLRVIRLLGAAASGLIVGMIVFSGSGGFGLGGGFGPGEGGTGQVSPQSMASGTGEPKPTGGGSLRISLLGGSRVQGAAFYRLDGESKARTLAELQRHLRELKEKGWAPTKLELRIYDDSVAKDHPAVGDLVAWAMLTGIGVSVEIMPTPMPPLPKSETP